ncbi:MAG: aquaporin family protein [Alphaproteobacteria bacterium]|nr:aquaporin family protein [Alphaproteobacteria bacterium]
MPPDLARRLGAEYLGTLLLVATVVGSGIMAERLAHGNDAIALLANTGATVAVLAVLILSFGPQSGAHFNPAVSLAMAACREQPWRDVPGYVGAQVAGGLCGTWLAHAMFALLLLQASTKIRSGPSQWLAELVATFGLLLTIRAVSRNRPAAVPYAVALWIGAAYWFTASTSFANPAVTLARAFSDSFAGIRPADAPGFVLAQLAGAGLAIAGSRWLYRNINPAS